MPSQPQGQGHVHGHIQGQGLVFAGGCPRSGLAVLRRLLTADRRLYCGSDTGIAAAIAQQWDAFATQLSGLHESSFDLPPEAVRANMAGLIDDLLGAPLKHKDDVRVIEKTPLNILTFERLAALLPGARFIHVVRDGRDTAHSLLERDWRDGSGQPLAYVSRPDMAVEYWSQMVEKGLKAEKAIGRRRCLRVRYEALVRQPADMLGRIQRFLGLEPKRITRFDHPLDWQGLECDSLPALNSPISTQYLRRDQALEPLMGERQKTLMKTLRAR